MSQPQAASRKPQAVSSNRWPGYSRGWDGNIGFWIVPDDPPAYPQGTSTFSSEIITAQVWKTLKRAAIGLFTRHLKTPSQPYFHLYNQYVPRHLGPIPIAIAKPKSITRSNSFKKDSSIVGNLTATQLWRSAAWDSVLDKRRSDHHHRATSILMKLSFSHRG